MAVPQGVSHRPSRIESKEESSITKQHPAKSMQQPLSIFPLELVQVIFNLAASISQASLTEIAPKYEDCTAQLAPFRLAAVCAQWRVITLETPELWATIHVPGCMKRHVSAFVTLHLLRSNQWPLNIVVNLGSPHFGPFEGQNLYDMLGGHAARWRRCHFTFPLDDTSTWESLPFSLPLLEELVVVPAERHPRSLNPVNSSRQLGDAPRLRRLTIHGVFMLNQPISNLEYLSINLRNTPTDLLWKIIGNDPTRLRTLRVFWPFYQERSDYGPQRPTKLSRLERLEIYGHTADDFSSWVGELHMPALHTLVASTYTCYVLQPLFTQVSSHLKTLILRYEGGSLLAAPDARSLFALTGLETLRINGRYFDASDDIADWPQMAQPMLHFSDFFQTLRDGGGLRSLKRLELEECYLLPRPQLGELQVSPEDEDDPQPELVNFVISFTDSEKRDGWSGWHDSRLADLPP